MAIKKDSEIENVVEEKVEKKKNSRSLEADGDCQSRQGT